MAEPTYDELLGEILEHDHVAEDISGDPYLKLDQTTQQTVINGLPIFGEGLIIKAGEKLIFDR